MGQVSIIFYQTTSIRGIYYYNHATSSTYSSPYVVITFQPARSVSDASVSLSVCSRKTSPHLLYICSFCVSFVLPLQPDRMRSFVPIVLSLILGMVLSQELGVTPLEKDEEHGQLRRKLCSPSIFLNKSNYAPGETIQPTVSVCAYAVEWFGIWQAGTNPYTASALNWQYTCGGQTCAYPLNPGLYIYDLNWLSGSNFWPLPYGSYQVYYNSAFGSLIGPQFTVGAPTHFRPVGTGTSAPVAVNTRRPAFRSLWNPEEEDEQKLLWH